MANKKLSSKETKMDTHVLGDMHVAGSKIADLVAKVAHEAFASSDAKLLDSSYGVELVKAFARKFDCQVNQKASTCLCTQEVFEAFIDDARVAKITDDISEAFQRMEKGEITSKEYEDTKRKLKDQLPTFVFGGHSTSGKRQATCIQSSGLAMLDIDHIECDPKELYDDKIKGHEEELRIAAVHMTPSMRGMHIIFELSGNETREAANERIFTALGLDNDPRVPEGYDKAVKDLARCSYAVPRKYFFYIDRGLLFHRSDDPQLCKAAMPKAATKRASKAAAKSAPAAQPKSSGDTTKDAAPIQDKMSEMQGMKMLDRVCNEIADIDIKALDTDGQRHNNLMAVLCTGVTKVVPRELTQKWVEQRMPSYAGETDCQALIDDYYTTYLNPNLPLTKQLREIRSQELGLSSQATAAVAADIAIDDADTWENQQLQLADKIKKLLPRGLSDTLYGVPLDMTMAVLCTVLPAAAAYASQVRVEYIDGKICYLGLMSCCVGPFASGKGLCEDRIKLWTKKMDEEAKRARIIEDEYREKKATADKRKEKAPKDPRPVVQKVPFTISNTQLAYRMQNAQGQTLFSFTPELSTVVSLNKRGAWANKNSIYLKAFDGSSDGQDFHSVDSVSCEVEYHYNWAVTTTYNTLYVFFNADAVGNGLPSRLLFAPMSDTSFQHITKRPQPSAAHLAHIDEAVEKLCAAKGTLKLHRVCAALEKWVNDMADKAKAACDHAADDFRRRAAMIAYRCATIVYLLTGKESKRVVEFAVLMAQYTFYGQMRLFAEAYDDTSVKACQKQQRFTVNGNIFDQLPQQFTKSNISQLKSAVTRKPVTDGSLRQIICTWTKAGWIVKKGNDLWEKTADYATLLTMGNKPGNVTSVMSR